MSGYQAFALFYDELTRNIDYPARAEYFLSLIKRHSRREVKILLDLACGTGSLSHELASKGFEMIGVDASSEMLSAAAAKTRGGSLTAPVFVCQDMRELDLYGTVDACVCALDSLNHLPDTGALERTVAGVSLFLAPGGVFAFDVNTAYKHRELMGNNVFVFDVDAVYCVWRNECGASGIRVSIELDFFIPNRKGGYERVCESFTERLFTRAQISRALDRAGLELVAVYGADAFEPPSEKTDREVYVARKPL